MEDSENWELKQQEARSEEALGWDSDPLTAHRSLLARSQYVSR